MQVVPRMERVMDGSELRAITLGHPLIDAYLEFVGARGAVNTGLATAYDLKVFFTVISGKEPDAGTARDVLAFLAAQRAPRREHAVVRLETASAGLSATHDRPAAASMAGLFAYLIARGDGSRTATRCRAGRRLDGPLSSGARGVRLVRRPRTLPRVLSPSRWMHCWVRCARTGIGPWCWRCCWRGCAAARCSVCASGRSCRRERRSSPRARAGRERIVPVSDRFFERSADVLRAERPADRRRARCFVVLQRPDGAASRCRPAGVDQVLGARDRAGQESCRGCRRPMRPCRRRRDSGRREWARAAGGARRPDTRSIDSHPHLSASRQRLAGGRVPARGGRDRGADREHWTETTKGRGIVGYRLARDPEVETLIAAYRADLWDIRPFRRQRR